MEGVKNDFLRSVIRGVIVAVGTSLALVLLFALILNLTGLSDAVIRPVNQFIKLISVFGGCLVAVKGDKGWLKGLIIGFVSTLLSILIFALLAGGFNGIVGVIVDLVFGAAMGAISGIICVNLPRKNF